MSAWVAAAREYGRVLCLAAALCCVVGRPAHAVVLLAPGASGVPPELDLNIAGFLTPTIARPFSIDLGGGGTNVISGHLNDRVLLLQDDRYAFETTVFVTSAPAGAPGINKVARTDYTGFPTVEVGWEPQDIGNLFAPDLALRSLGAGSDVEFNFASHPIVVPPDADTTWATFVIITDPTPIGFGKFRAGVLSGADARFSNLVDVFSPVPEPQTWLALLMGVGALIGMRRRATRG